MNCMKLSICEIEHYYAELQSLAEEDVRKRMDALEVMNHELWLMMVRSAEDAICAKEEAEALKKSVGELSRELASKDREIETKEVLMAELKAKELSVWEQRKELADEWEEQRSMQEELAPKIAPNHIMSKNALLARIGFLVCTIGERAKTSIADCFEQGYDKAWLDAFWSELHKHPEWVTWMTDGQSIRPKQFLMVIGKLMTLRVFKRNAAKLCKCFVFNDVTTESTSRYINCGVSDLATVQPLLSTWIEQYVATHLPAPEVPFSE